MDRQDAERITTEYLKSIYGFALKRCADTQDAEDLSQEIVMKVFRSLLSHDDIEDVGKFVWTVAHNALANYYRDCGRAVSGVPVDDMAEFLHDSSADVFADIEFRETAGKLHREIAYLSKMQRKIIIAYYYENKKQSEIAAEFNIPLGTVKWHLFEAKKDLKRGMETVRNTSELKFNPVKFDMCLTNGTIGSKGKNSDFFRSALSQNIAYAVWKAPKSVNEIADALGVSPVYVESEAEYLYEYGFLTKHGDRYLCNVLIDEPTSEINQMRSEMYEKAATIFANELFDAISQSGILDSDRIICAEKNDKNYMMWALFPYIAADCGNGEVGMDVPFDEVATLRPDGGHNICYASVTAPAVEQPKFYDSIKRWNGPWCFADEKYVLWQTASEWSDTDRDMTSNSENSRDLTLLNHFLSDIPLTNEEYAHLAERGYIRTAGDPDKIFKAELLSVWIRDEETNRKLLALGDDIKARHRKEFEAFKADYVKAVMSATPEHLCKMQMFGLQNIFYCDAWFILHCLKLLIAEGKLKLPTAQQRKSISTVILTKN